VAQDNGGGKPTGPPGTIPVEHLPGWKPPAPKPKPKDGPPKPNSGKPKPGSQTGKPAPKPAPRQDSGAAPKPTTGTPRAGSQVPSSSQRSSGGGSHGLSRAQVIALQKKIGATPDGVFGPQTRAALVHWQGANGLVADGIPGPLTLAKAGIGSGSTGSGAKAGTGAPAASGGGAKAPAPAAAKGIDYKQMEADYGWSMAVLNSDPELKAKFDQAVKESWSPGKFVAEIQGTQWYQKHGEAARQAWILQKADPATFNQRVATKMADVVAQSNTYGVKLSADQARKMATDAMTFGWDDNQVRTHIAAYASYSSTTSPLSGSAGAAALRYKRIAADYGQTLDDGQLSSLVRGTINGTVDESWVTKWAMDHAKSAYPALQKRLDAGETLAQIADPYKQAYAKVLEVNPDTINLDDRLVKQALQGKDDKGQPATQSLWQFEDTLRNDSRWSQTQNARDSAAATAHGVLQTFGLVN
jgi:peptidoglycan hydrolase-like protein with peptidoglycan-binding domain